MSLEPFHDFSVLLRGDVKTQTEAWARGVQWGWFSVNDVRELMGENPIGPEGDEYLRPVNMEVAGDDDPPKDGGDVEDTDDAGDDDPPAGETP